MMQKVYFSTDYGQALTINVTTSLDVTSLTFSIRYFHVFLALKETFFTRPYKAFVPNAPFLYPLKTSENLTVFWCFQGIEKGYVGNEWVNNVFSRMIILMTTLLTRYWEVNKFTEGNWTSQDNTSNTWWVLLYGGNDCLGKKQIRKALVATTTLKRSMWKFQQPLLWTYKRFTASFSFSYVFTFHFDEETLGHFFILCRVWSFFNVLLFFIAFKHVNVTLLTQKEKTSVWDIRVHKRIISALLTHL